MNFIEREVSKHVSDFSSVHKSTLKLMIDGLRVPTAEWALEIREFDESEGCCCGTTSGSLNNTDFNWRRHIHYRSRWQRRPQ
jgi:hypothetical protein